MDDVILAKSMLERCLVDQVSVNRGSVFKTMQGLGQTFRLDRFEQVVEGIYLEGPHRMFIMSGNKNYPCIGRNVRDELKAF